MRHATRAIRASLALFCLVLAASGPAIPAQEVPRDINDTFKKSDLDVKNFVERFESESREVFAKREAIAAALGIEPGMAVADVGAGTGLFTRLFAGKVGPAGRVYAVDIAPAFLGHIDDVAAAQGQSAVIETVLGTQDSTRLPKKALDLVFICDTYHHFEQPAVMLKSIRQALKKGGRLAVIDFDRHEGASDFIKTHVRADRETFFKEIEAAGFVRAELANPPELKENFFAVFTRAPRLAEDKAGRDR